MDKTTIMIFLATAVGLYFTSLFIPSYKLIKENNILSFKYLKVRSFVKLAASIMIMLYPIFRYINGCFGEFCEFNSCSTILNNIMVILLYLVLLIQALAEIKIIFSSSILLSFNNEIKSITRKGKPLWSYNEINKLGSKGSNNPLCPGRRVYAENISGEQLTLFCLELSEDKMDKLLSELSEFTGLKVDCIDIDQSAKD